MRDATRVPVTVKCRIGIDDRDDYEFFAQFVDAWPPREWMRSSCTRAPPFSAAGLVPKENREIPPLKYDYVHRLKQRAALATGGAQRRLRRGAIGAHSWRRARRRDARAVRPTIGPQDAGGTGAGGRGPGWKVPSPGRSSSAWCPTPGAGKRGVRLHSITRHMHGVMAGREGARAWRRFLSEVARGRMRGRKRCFQRCPY
jgi:tRNA-dihydrouridine synthase A